MNKFIKVFIGQAVSKQGMTLSAFVLSLWVLQSHHSILEYSIFVFLISIPGAIISPIAGSIIDYLGNKVTLYICDFISVIVSSLLYFLCIGHNLTIAVIYFFVFIASIIGAFQSISYVTLAAQLVPKHKYSSINGLIQIGQESGYFIMPLVAGVCYNALSIESFFLIDVITSLFALTSLLLAKISVGTTPKPQRTSVKFNLKAIKLGWKFHKANPVLMKLFLTIILMNLIEGIFLLLLAPRIMLIFKPAVLGIVMLSAGLGVIFGGIYMGIDNQQKKFLQTIYIGSLVMSISMVIMGKVTTLLWCCCFSFLFCFCTPLVFGYTRVLYLESVPLEQQGRIFGFKNFFDRFSAAASYLLVPLLSAVINGGLMFNGTYLLDFASYSLPSLSYSLIFPGIMSVILLSMVFIAQSINRYKLQNVSKI